MNIYIQIIKELSHDNKYLKWYITIIQNAQNRASNKKEAKKLLEYCEKHHILPKSFNLGGEKDELNFAYLTAREHFIAHLLLLKFLKKFIYRAKMAGPVLRMCGNSKSSRLYEIAKKLAAKNSPAKTKEFQNKKRKTTLNKIGVENHNQLIIICPYCNKSGKKGGMILSHFDNCKQNPNRTTEILTCPHCNKSGDKSNMLQFHFDLCKKNPNRIKKPKKEYICPHCGKIGSNGSAMTKNHFDNCLKNPNSTRKLIICPYCNFSSYNYMGMANYHFDNCKLSPVYVPKLYPTITCPHCGKQGTNKPDMLRWHFNNCKDKKT